MTDVYRRRHLIAGGYSDRELGRMRRSGVLSTVRRGAYVPGALPDDPLARHRLEVVATLAEMRPDTVVSHVSAAVLHGLRIWGVPIDRVDVTRDRRRSGCRVGSRVHLHNAPLEPHDVVRIDGLFVTSLARTLCDFARTRPYVPSVVAIDGALHRHLVGKPELIDVLAAMPRWPGLPAARRAIAFAAPGSMSVGESRSRVAIESAGLPPPVLQWVTSGAEEVDFYWEQWRTVGEFDGKAKYGRLLLPGEDPAEAVYREKLREDRIRATGLRVVRWTWQDISDFEPIAKRIRGE